MDRITLTVAGGLLAAVAVFWLLPTRESETEMGSYSDSSAEELSRLETENARLREALADARAETTAATRPPGLEPAPGTQPRSLPTKTPESQGLLRQADIDFVQHGSRIRWRGTWIDIPKNLKGTPELWITAIRKGLEVGRHDLVQHAHHALHAMGTDAGAALTAAFRREDEPEVFRMSMLGALMRADRERGLAVARDWLSTARAPSPLRTSLLAYYAQSKPSEVPSSVVRLINDPETPAADRSHALLALMSADPAAASEQLRAMIYGRDESDQGVARSLLQQAHDPQLRSLVLEVARTANALDRQKYVTALAAMKGVGWGRVQITGEPDTFGGGDQRTAWASKKGEEGHVTVEVDFPTALRPERVRVHETFNPGAIIRVEGRRAGSEWTVLWEGEPKAARAPRWFEPALAETETAVASVRLTLDTNAIKGWNEIDAVQLVGDGQTLYATEARCSSCYAGDTGH